MVKRIGDRARQTFDSFGLRTLHLAIVTIRPCISEISERVCRVPPRNRVGMADRPFYRCLDESGNTSARSCRRMLSAFEGHLADDGIGTISGNF